MLKNFKFLSNKEINGLFAVALVLEATLASSTGKLEALGSSFRHETAGLLPYLTTTDKVLTHSPYPHKYTSK